MSLPFAKFPSIEGLHNVVKLSKSYPHLFPNAIEYKGKIKLHGANTAIRTFKGNIQLQSREIFIENGHYGFVQWVQSNIDYWQNLGKNEELTIYGEWCGKGIAKGAAINQVDVKIFAVFAIMLGEVTDPECVNNVLVTEPEKIISILKDCPNNTFVLPWLNQAILIDYKNKETLVASSDYINSYIEKIEPCDPWVNETFNIQGVAEGVVYYPQGIENNTVGSFRNLSFKAKGKKHKVNANKKKEAVQIDPEVAKDIEDFVSMFLTEQRLEQGVLEIGLDLELTLKFIQWICIDISKESKEELAVSNLDWKLIHYKLSCEARNWFVNKCKEI